MYLPFALRKLAQLAEEAAASGGYASKFIKSDDGASISLSIAGEEQRLHIKASPGGYQFFCTGRYANPQAGPFGLLMQRGYAVDVHLEKGKIKARALGSTMERDPLEAPGTPARWKYSAEAQDISAMFPKKHIWQIDAIPQHVFFPKGGATPTGAAGYPFLVNAWPASKQIAGMNLDSVAFQKLAGTTDIGYDAAANFFAKAGNNAPRGADGLAPDADWYRRAAMQTVVHEEFGARRFIVLTDTSNTFHVFPVAVEFDDGLKEDAPQWYQDQNIKTSVPPEFARQDAAPLPEWASKSKRVSRDTPSLPIPKEGQDAFYRDVPQYQWQFNSLGTKACSIVYERLGATPPLTAEEEDQYTTETLPGMVELDVTITITGKELKDFTFHLGLARAWRPSTDKKYFMACGYSWRVPAKRVEPPPEVPPPNTADLDDLITITGHLHYHVDIEALPNHYDYMPRIGEPQSNWWWASAGVVVLRVRNLTKDTLVREFLVRRPELHTYNPPELRGGPPPGKKSDTLYAKVLAYDLRILAFALEERYTDTQWSSYPNGYPNYQATRGSTRVRVFAFNELEETRFLDPDAPLNAALVAGFDAPAHAVGMVEYPCSARATNQYPYWGPGDTFAEESVTTHYARSGVPFDFDMGAMAYALYVYPAVCPGEEVAQERFVVHPSGSWSFATFPIFRYGGVSYPYRVPSNEYADTDVGDMKQIVVDIINLRANGRDFRTTHLKCFNQAYEKELTEQDFHYQFTTHDVQAIADPLDPDGPTYTVTDGRAQYLGIHAQSPPGVPDPYSAYLYIGKWRGVYSLPGEIDSTGRQIRYGLVPQNTKLVLADLRHRFNLLDRPAPHQMAYRYDYYPYPSAEIIGLTQRSPLIRGSGLFY